MSGASAATGDLHGAGGPYFVLGDDAVGEAIADHLRSKGEDVVLVGAVATAPDTANYPGDPAALDVLTSSGVESAGTVVVATRTDRRNLLIAQLVRSRFDAPRVVVLVHDPDRIALFEAAGHEPLCVSSVLSAAFGAIA